MSAIQEFTSKVQEFVASHRRDGLEPYRVSGAYDLCPHLPPTAIVPNHRWPESWPNSPHAGVYALFCDNLSLAYIGKSSMNSFLGARLSSYFGNAPDKTCRIKGEWRIQPRFLVTVAVPDSATWEAPALEEFLIQQLNPPLNRNGRSA